MIKELTRPKWYDDEFYNQTRTPEEWLYELWKRYQFNHDKIGLPHSIYEFPLKEQERYFLEFIFDKKIEKFLEIFLKGTPPQPIRYPSVSDILIMHHLLTNTDWYKNNPNREVFESAIPKIINDGVLSREQQILFHEMYKTPWCAFHDNYQQDSWCPKKEMEYLSGIPVSIDPAYAKEDTIKTLKKKLNAWVGKIQGIQFQFDRWQERKILAVFDLKLWFKIKKIEFTNIGIHKLIWPKGRFSNVTGELINPDDDIAHSIDLVNRAIDKGTICSLLSMCEHIKFKS